MAYEYTVYTSGSDLFLFCPCSVQFGVKVNDFRHASSNFDGLIDIACAKLAQVWDSVILY